MECKSNSEEYLGFTKARGGEDSGSRRTNKEAPKIVSPSDKQTRIVLQSLPRLLDWKEKEQEIGSCCITNKKIGQIRKSRGSQ